MQLDGPSLEALLTRAREEYGNDVQIVKAGKGRTGGIAGFFARECYQLTVQVPDTIGRSAPPAAPADAPRVAAPSPLVSPAAPAAATRATSPARARGKPQRTNAPRPCRRGQRARARGGGASVDGNPEPPASNRSTPTSTPGFAPAREESPRSTAGRGEVMSPTSPSMSTDSSSFASVLADLTDAVGSTFVGAASAHASAAPHPSDSPRTTTVAPVPTAQPLAVRAPLVRVLPEHAASVLDASRTRSSSLRDLGASGTALLPGKHMCRPSTFLKWRPPAERAGRRAARAACPAGGAHRSR